MPGLVNESFLLKVFLEPRDWRVGGFKTLLKNLEREIQHLAKSL
jgi:hypothetical protein